MTLIFVEDNCEGMFGKYEDTFSGMSKSSLCSSCSFYGNKIITTGEGGAVFTNNTKLKKVLESLRDWGRDCYCPPGEDNTCKKRFDWQLGGLPHGYDHKYVYSHAGFNLKMTDIGAACGISQLDKIDFFITKRLIEL